MGITTKADIALVALKANTASLALTASYFSGSISNATSASYALTASYLSGSISNATSASYALTSSFALTASYFSGSISNATSASFAITSGLAQRIEVVDLSGAAGAYEILFVDSSGSQIAYAELNNFYYVPASDTLYVDNIQVSQSLTARGVSLTGSFSGSLVGTASWANNAISASYAATASYAQNIIISGSINSASYIDFTTNYIVGTNEPAWKEGRLFYDSGSGALAMYNWEADVTLNIGQESWLRARNQTGVTITNGTVVRLVGAIGDRPTVEPAQAIDQTNTFSLTNEIIGMATHDIENGTDGFITTFGLVNGINTSAFSAGDLLWVSQSAGQFTSTAPAPPYDKIFVGIVTRANPSNGSIFMTPLTSIHFHDIASVSASIYQMGDLWMYRSGSAGQANAWINTKALTGSYSLSGSLNVNGSITSSLFGTASWAQSASNAVTSSVAASAVTVAITNTTSSGGGPFYPMFTSTNSGNGSALVDSNIFLYAPTTNTLTVTASYATQAISASYSDTASYLNPGTYIITASWAQSASNALSASRATSASYALVATSASFLPVGTYNITASWAQSASQAVSASYVLQTVSASFASTSSFLNPGTYLITSSWATSASQAITASYVLNAISSSFASTASFVATASWANNAVTASRIQTIRTSAATTHYLTFVDTSNAVSTEEVLYTTNAVTINPISSSISATSFTGSLLGTASWAVSASQAITASRATSSSYALSASYALIVPAAGASTNVQYNSNGNLAGSNRFKFDGTTLTLDGASLSITGSLMVSGSTVNAPGLDTTTAVLTRGTIIKIDWANGYLQDSTGTTSTDWENRTSYDSAGGSSIEWNGRVLYDSGINTSIDWENRLLSTPGGYNALVYSNDITANSELYIKQVIGTGIQEDAVSSTTYSGQIIIGTLTGVSTHQLVYLDTDGAWKPTKATVANGAAKMLGICVDSAKNQILIEGDAPVSDDNSQGAYVIGADHGLPVYVSATTGVMTVTAPSGTGELVRIVGHIYYQSTTDTNWWTMKFRPSNDWYEQ